MISCGLYEIQILPIFECQISTPDAMSSILLWPLHSIKSLLYQYSLCDIFTFTNLATAVFGDCYPLEWLNSRPLNFIKADISSFWSDFSIIPSTGFKVYASNCYKVVFVANMILLVCRCYMSKSALALNIIGFGCSNYKQWSDTNSEKFNAVIRNLS